MTIDRVGADGDEIAALLARIVPTFKRYVPPTVSVEQTPKTSGEQ